MEEVVAEVQAMDVGAKAGGTETGVTKARGAEVVQGARVAVG
jgi:hypothetical protein